MQCGVRRKFARAIKKEPTISRRRRCWVAASSGPQSLLISNTQEQTIWFGWTHRLQICCISDQRGPHRRKMKNGECCTLLKVGGCGRNRSWNFKKPFYFGCCFIPKWVHSPNGTCRLANSSTDGAGVSWQSSLRNHCLGLSFCSCPTACALYWTLQGTAEGGK